MGNQPSNTLHLRTSRLSSNGGNGDNPKNRLLREHKRHGVVSVKINSSNSGRRLGEGQISHIVTPKGAILYGSLFNPTAVQRGIASSSLPVLVPGDIAIPDSRANKLLVSYCYGWHLIPFPEVFSRHSGTCYVVGDRNVNGPPVQIKVGDCFRLGSVGLVVSEMKIDEENEQKIDAKTLQFLKDEALAFDTNEDLAALASDEMMEGDGRERVGSDVGGGGLDGSLHQSFDADDQTNRGSIDGDGNASPTPFSPGNGLTNGERFICYMCYETHNTPEDPLIAPCECKGDTRFLHVHCLQKWYHTSAYGSHAQVVRTTGNGAPACKICGTAYKTNFKRSDGRRASILELENSGPYLSLVVVTHHDTNPGLFNTKFRLNFGRRNGISAAISDSDLNTVVIGRSSSCAMILDYRTVSTIHAKITYQNGKFFLSDNRSSNGTMIYIREPLPISYSQPVKIRMGRTTLSLQAKRSWTAAMRSFVFGTNPNDEANELALQSQIGLPSPSDVMNLLVQLHNLPPDKNSSNHETEGSHHPPTFLNHRSYTIRTINEGSVDGGEFDRLTDGGHGLAQHFHDFGNYGQDRFFVDGNEARQTPDNRRASESNSPMAMSPSPSHQQFNEENNQPNRIFLNNNSGSGHHQLFNSQASHSGREGGEPIITHSNEGSRQFRHIEFAEGDKTANNIYNNLQDITTDSHLPLSPNSTGGMRKTSLTAHEAVLMKEKTSILSKAASEAPFRDDEIEVEEDVVASNVSTMLSSPPRERGAGSTIVVGNHVEGNEIFQSINGSDNMTPGLVSQKSVANTEGVPAATIPVANVFALPSSAGSHRRGSSSVTPVNVISDDMEGVLRTVPSEEKSNN